MLSQKRLSGKQLMNIHILPVYLYTKAGIYIVYIYLSHEPVHVLGVTAAARRSQRRAVKVHPERLRLHTRTLLLLLLAATATSTAAATAEPAAAPLGGGLKLGHLRARACGRVWAHVAIRREMNSCEPIDPKELAITDSG